MVRYLLQFDERDIDSGTSAAERHVCAMGGLVIEMLTGWAIGRPGLRGGLFSVPFGFQRHLFLEALPELLDPPAWKAPMEFVLHPDHDPEALIRGFVLVGVSPHAHTLWREMAPSAPTSWLDLAFPTDRDAHRVRRELGGTIAPRMMFGTTAEEANTTGRGRHE